MHRGTEGRRSARRAGVVAMVCVLLAGAACTDDPKPAATDTTEATGVTATIATLEGSVSQPDDGTISYWFEYGPTTSYGSQTPERSLEIDDREPVAIADDLTGLEPETTIHYRACAEADDTVCGEDMSFVTAAASTITASPALYPAFDPAVTDYVTRCNDAPVTVSVSAPSVTTVGIADEPPATGELMQEVPLVAGEAFTLTTTTSERASEYHVRCLPEDFPDWTYSRPGVPSARFYVTTPSNVAAPDGGAAGPYVAIFDDRGVPVWWQEAANATDAKVLPDGTLGWAITEPDATFNLGTGTDSGFLTHELDGTLLHTWNTVDIPTDFHDFQLLENGNALIGAYPARPGTADLTEYGGPAANGTLLDGAVQEITPAGEVVWSWSTKDHIDPSETPERWRAEFVYGLPHELPDGRNGFDWVHLNSIQQTDDTVLMSFRHLDAVYLVDKADGEIIWKLGGTTTPESLTVVDDPEANPLGGQHVARLLPDGTVTVYDNNSEETTPPRGVRYEIDLEARTATMIESISDPAVTKSACCGSAVRLEDGSWVLSWGGTRVIGEYGPEGDPHFTLTFKELPEAFGISYRVDAVDGDGPTVEDLRAGMDAIHAAG